MNDIAMRQHIIKREIWPEISKYWLSSLGNKDLIAIYKIGSGIPVQHQNNLI
nr:hypothetical protein [Methanosaeta sp. UBA356]